MAVFDFHIPIAQTTILGYFNSPSKGIGIAVAIFQSNFRFRNSYFHKFSAEKYSFFSALHIFLESSLPILYFYPTSPSEHSTQRLFRITYMHYLSHRCLGIHRKISYKM